MILYKRLIHRLIKAPADRNAAAIGKYTFRSTNPDNFVDVHGIAAVRCEKGVGFFLYLLQQLRKNSFHCHRLYFFKMQVYIMLLCFDIENISQIHSHRLAALLYKDVVFLLCRILCSHIVENLPQLPFFHRLHQVAVRTHFIPVKHIACI